MLTNQSGINAVISSPIKQLSLRTERSGVKQSHNLANLGDCFPAVAMTNHS